MRIAELENSYENGDRMGFGAYNVVKFEGWPNFGIWNINFPRKYGGEIAYSSLGFMLRYAGREDLFKYDPGQPEVIAKFLGSEEGVNVQLHQYMNQWIIGPAIRQLREVGFDFEEDEEKEFDQKTYSPFYQRLIALACDIAVNSGPYGFFPKCVPRIWDGVGILAWSGADYLPSIDECITAFEVEFKCHIPAEDQFSVRVDSRTPYRNALKKCLWDICKNDEQRINLIAELQARAIPPKATGGDETLQALVLRRRRSVARKDGYSFQGVRFHMGDHFGIGV
jgi:hypothetical protein